MPQFELLPKLAKALLSVPPGNAGSERTFSRKIDTEFRSELGHDTICALLSVKINSYHKPSEFIPSQASQLFSYYIHYLKHSVNWDDKLHSKHVTPSVISYKASVVNY